MPELLGGYVAMVIGTQAADVAVIIGATLRERYDVVGHGGSGNAPDPSAQTAERLVSEASKPLRLAGSAAEALDHRTLQIRQRPQAGGLRAELLTKACMAHAVPRCNLNLLHRSTG